MTITHEHFLFATSSEQVSVFNLKLGRMQYKVDMLEDEMLCVCMAKNENYAVMGTQCGNLDILKWGTWDALEAMIPGHPTNIDCMVSFSEDTVITGCGDGFIRAVDIMPTSITTVVGDHNDHSIEKMSISHDKKYLASAGHDQVVKFWNITYLTEAEQHMNIEKNDKIGAETNSIGGRQQEDNTLSEDDVEHEQQRPTKKKKGGSKNRFFNDL